MRLRDHDTYMTFRDAQGQAVLNPAAGPVGGEVRVNTFTTGAQTNPAITVLSDGTSVVAWTSTGQDGSGEGVYAQRFAADGSPLGSEFRVATTTADDQRTPSLTALSDGGFIVTWQGRVSGGDGFDIYAQRFSGTAIPQGSQFVVNTTTASFQGSSSVAGFPGGGFVVTWHSLGASETSDVYARRFNADGSPASGEFRVNSFLTGNQDEAAVAVLAGGGFVVTWQSENQDGSSRGVYAQLYNASGSPVGGEFRANTTTANLQGLPSVTALEGGGFVIVWGGAAVRGQIYAADGTPVGGEIPIAAGFSGFSVTAMTGGGFAVAWDEIASPGVGDGAGFAVVARAFNASGQPLGDAPSVINETSAGDQRTGGHGSIDQLADGSLAIVWAGNGTGDTSGVFLRRYDLGGAVSGPGPIVGTSGPDTLTGTTGDDVLRGLGGDDAIDGLGGNDIAEYSGTRYNYRVTALNGGIYTIEDLRSGSPDGSDTLRNIERLRFADGEVVAIEDAVIGASNLEFDAAGRRFLSLGDLSPPDGFDTFGAAAGDQSGFSVTAVGDVNGDGVGDWVIGAPGNDRGGAGAGIAYVIFGQEGQGRADISLGSLSGTNGFAIVGAAAGDRLGSSVAMIGDVNDDGVNDILVGASGSQAGGTNSGAAYVIFGVRSASRSDITLATLPPASGFMLTGAAGDFAGGSVSSAGDLNGDDIPDFIVGAAGSAASEGRVYVVLGRSDFSSANPLALGAVGITITGDNAFDQFGSVVSYGGDVNGDGLADIVIGAAHADPSTSAAGTDGRVYVLYGGSTLLTSGGDVTGMTSADGFVIRGAAGSLAGTSVSSAGIIESNINPFFADFQILGDLNGDGYDDILIGAPGANGSAGEAYVVFGKPGASRGTLDLANLSPTDGFVIRGDAGLQLGFSVSAAGDVDNDGAPDLLIAATGPGTGGATSAAYLIFGRGASYGSPDAAGRYVLDLTHLDQTDGIVLVRDANAPNAAGGRFSVSAIGDVNGDFIDDFMVNDALGDIGGIDAGHGYVVLGRREWLDRTIPDDDSDAIEPVGQLPATGAVRFTGPTDTTTTVGMNVAAIGDVNGDGIADFVVQAHVNDPVQGEVNVNYVFFGRPGFSPGNFNLADFGPADGFRVFAPEGPYGFGVDGYSASGVAAAGDFNGDGIDDMLFQFTRPGDANTPSYTSGVFLVYGQAGTVRGDLRLDALSAADGVQIVKSGYYGFGAGIGDINADGIDDIAISDTNGFTSAADGVAYILYGRTASIGTPNDPANPNSPATYNVDEMTPTDGFRIFANEGFNQFPGEFAAIGDVNGDGIADFVLGDQFGGSTEFSQIGQGKVRIIFGQAGNTRSNFNIDDIGSNGITITGADRRDGAGQDVAGIGDINGDGYVDFLIGSNGPNGGQGRAYVIFGKPAAAWVDIDLATLSAADGFVIQGDVESDAAGYSVSGVGDFNGDGFADFVIGAPENEQITGVAAGSIYVLFGHAGTFGTIDGTGRQVIDLTFLTPDQGIQFVGERDQDYLGGTVAGIGDINGDGYGDVLAGAANYFFNSGFPDSSTSAHSQAYVIFGGPAGAAPDTSPGTAGNDIRRGTAGNDIFYLQQGGDDFASGGDGNDGFYFGSAYTSGDTVDGGAGNLDQLGLQGNYSAGLTLGAMTGIEMVVLLAGNDARFGGATGTNLSYNITVPDSAVAAGQTLIFQANTLRAGENFTLDGSAETNGNFITYGGLGTDNLTGGAGDDGFFFGDNRLFSSVDIVNGGGGTDQLGLQGNFTGVNALVFGAAQLTSIEFIVLLSATDSRFGAGGGLAAYDLTMNDGNVAAGQRLIVSANALKASEALTFNGSVETNGSFQIFSGAGNDNLRGSQGADDVFAGAGNDIIAGGGGADTLRGGAGNDVFAYAAASDSTVAARDQLLDFATGDTIDLSALAAAVGGSFTFIGSGTQSGARQVQVSQNGNQATAFIFIDGDAIADMAINITVTDGHQLTLADFGGGMSGVLGQAGLPVTDRAFAADMHIGPPGDLVTGLSAPGRFGLQPIDPISLPDTLHNNFAHEFGQIATLDLSL